MHSFVEKHNKNKANLYSFTTKSKEEFQKLL